MLAEILKLCRQVSRHAKKTSKATIRERPASKPRGRKQPVILDFIQLARATSSQVKEAWSINDDLYLQEIEEQHPELTVELRAVTSAFRRLVRISQRVSQTEDGDVDVETIGAVHRWIARLISAWHSA